MIIEPRLLNWPNFALVAFVAALLIAASHLAVRGLQLKEGN